MSNGSGNVSSVITVGAANSASVGLASIPLSAPGATGSAQVFSLYGPTVTATVNGCFPLYKNGVKYQVPAGKTAYIFAMTAWSETATNKFQLLSATSTFNDATAAGSLVGAVFQGGATAAYCNPVGTPAFTVGLCPGLYTFTASTFPGFQTSLNNIYMINMQCYEI